MEKAKYLETILDVTPVMFFVVKNKKIIDVNKRFLQFFNLKNISEIPKEQFCIYKYFYMFDKQEFPDNKLIDGVLWYQYLLKHKDTHHTISLKKNDEIYYFNINAQYLDDDKSAILLTMQDITPLKEKEKMLIHQSKMASMGEMLTNIAHQWRQPLSMISTSATSIQMQQEYGMLDDKKLLDAMDNINNAAQFLSKTIEDFRNYFKDDKYKKEFLLSDMIEKTLKLVEANFQNNFIQIITDIDNIKITAIEGELIQVIINLLNNSRDAFKQNKNFDNIIKITIKQTNDNAVITLHDNAGGIPENIIDKIFEPYFTTKHQNQGTGIGLYMSYEIITKNMLGSIEVANDILNCDNNSRLGAKFIIKIPQ